MVRKRNAGLVLCSMKSRPWFGDSVPSAIDEVAIEGFATTYVDYEPTRAICLFD